MNVFRQYLIQFLIVGSLLLAWTGAQAQDKFERGGVITDLGPDSFVVENQRYRLSVGAKLRSFDPGRKKFTDFKRGDMIIFEGRMIGDTPYVDLIIYYAPVPS